MIIEQRNETIFFDVKVDNPDYDGDALDVSDFFKKKEESLEGKNDIQSK